MEELIHAVHSFILHNYGIAGREGGKKAEVFERALETHFKLIREEAKDGFERGIDRVRAGPQR